jgi:hypothetical protein
MRAAAKVLLFYLLTLFVCSLILSWLNLTTFFITVNGKSVEVRTMMLITIVCGIWALKLTVKPHSLKVFLIVYTALWAFRFLVLAVANHIGEAHILGRAFRFDLIIGNYYATVSRLETPLPFVIFWLINYFFSAERKPGNIDQSA